MKPNKPIVRLTVLIAAAIVAWLCFRWEKRIQAERMQAGSLDRETAAAEKELTGLHPHSRAGGPNGGRSEANGTQSFDGREAALLADQERRRAAAIHAWASRKEARFFRQSNLSSEQIAKVEAAIVAHWLRLSELVAAGRTEGLAPNDPAWKTVWKQEYPEYESDLTAALGPAGYAQFQQYERLGPAQTVTDAVAGLVYDSPFPLTPAQGDALTRLVAANSPAYQKGGTSKVNDLNIPAILTQAQTFLAPTQVAALRTSLGSSPAGSQLFSLLAAAQSAHPNGSP